MFYSEFCRVMDLLESNHMIEVQVKNGERFFRVFLSGSCKGLNMEVISDWSEYCCRFRYRGVLYGLRVQNKLVRVIKMEDYKDVFRLHDSRWTVKGV